MQTRALELPHGPAVIVRPLRNGDIATVMAVFARRRVNAHKCLSETELEVMATVDARRHALVAYVAGDPEPAGLAQLARVGERAAEVASVVADRYRHRGIASALTGLLLDDARAAGITEQSIRPAIA